MAEPLVPEETAFKIPRESVVDLHMNWHDVLRNSKRCKPSGAGRRRYCCREAECLSVRSAMILASSSTSSLPDAVPMYASAIQVPGTSGPPAGGRAKPGSP